MPVSRNGGRLTASELIETLLFATSLLDRAGVCLEVFSVAILALDSGLYLSAVMVVFL